MPRAPKWLVIIFVGALVIVAVDWLLSGASPEIYEISDYAKKRQTYPEIRALFAGPFFIATGYILKHHHDSVIALATVGLLIVTACLAVYTANLWGATNELVKGAEKTAKMELRAYLSVLVGTAIYQERERGLRFQAKPIIVNTGRTPAHNVGYKAAAAVLPVPLPSDFSFPLPARSSGASVLGPQQHFEMNVLVEDFVNEDEVPNIKLGLKGRAFYAWGIVVYRDVFGRLRKTEFCQTITWSGEGDAARIFGYQDQRHNKAT